MPAAGAGALVLIVGIVVAILASGGSNDDENDVAVDPDATPTAAVEESDDNGVADGDATPEPEATPGIDETPEPEATPDADNEEIAATPEAEETPEVAPEPTPVPIVGDFGELPAGDMPSGSPADAMNLEFRLDMSLQAIPREATVYQIQRRQWTLESVTELVQRLGIEGEVVDQGGGSFRAEGPAASIYISPNSVQYVRAADGEPAELPADEQLTQMARSWLTNNGLVGADLGPGRVLDRDTERGNAFVLLKPVEPAEIISATPSAGITIRGDGVVQEALINWPQSLQGSTYSLRTPEQLWDDASRGRDFIEVDINRLPGDFQGRSGSVTITSAGLAYTIAGGAGGSQFLVPIVVFSGTANIEGVEQPIPMRVFVQAVAAQVAPRG
jgi:hypothetical protein